ncbi:MAG: response regulator transcription factor [Phascolarctobacterium sp.]|nr:response regulator transcription factor [Phascolarctobacterium sp.]
MIWCVEDDANIRDIEVYTLNSTGFQASGFASGTEFFEALKSATPELVILDIMLPGEDGVAILNRLKTNPETSDIPVIMATAKGSEYDKIQSLDLGADDYMVKPFGMMEMVSRVKAVLRRVQKSEIKKFLRLDTLVLNQTDHTVNIDEERIQLTFKEYELLELFLLNPGKVFTRDMLFEKIWGMEYIGESRTVDMHIKTLRQKLKHYGNRIETVRHVGYRLEASK